MGDEGPTIERRRLRWRACQITWRRSGITRRWPQSRARDPCPSRRGEPNISLPPKWGPDRSEQAIRPMFHAQFGGGDDGNRTRVRGFADRSLNHSGTSPPVFHLAAPGRFERPLTDPKSAVLPLDDGAPMRSHASRSPLAQPAGQESGAEDGTRTRDPHLGKVMLYQLSHFRPLIGPDCTASHRCGWCRGPGSNWRHLDFQSSALPTELPRLAGSSGRRQGYRGDPPPATETATGSAPSGRRYSRAPGCARRSADACPTATSRAPRTT
jgi:hypothetical protein